MANHGSEYTTTDSAVRANGWLWDEQQQEWVPDPEYMRAAYAHAPGESQLHQLAALSWRNFIKV